MHSESEPVTVGKLDSLVSSFSTLYHSFLLGVDIALNELQGVTYHIQALVHVIHRVLLLLVLVLNLDDVLFLLFELQKPLET